jgi:hypothetical protein
MDDVLTKLFTAKEVIEASGWATCRLCEDVYQLRVETARYCNKCGNGFCESHHGSFAYGHGTCVVCGAHGKYHNSAIYADKKGTRKY